MSTTTASGAILTNSINAITSATGDISIGDSQTDGILNLGTGASRSVTGVINIGNSASLNKISIETSNTGNAWNTPAMSIGGAGSATKTIKIGTQTNSVVVSSLNISTASMNNLSPLLGGIQLGNAQSGGGLDLGTGTARTATGSINIANTNGCLCPVNILNGGATTGGSFNVANTGANSTTINIGSTTGTGVIKIDTANTNNDIPTNSYAIGIGASAVSKYIRINNPTVSCQTSIGNLQIGYSIVQDTVFYNAVNTVTATNLAFFDKQTTGKVNIGCGGSAPATRLAGGDINIANQASNACNVNVMNGNTTGGNVNIANGTGATQTTAVNIGSGSTTGTVTIGNSANTVQVNGTLAMASTKNITLKTDGTFPTAGTQLGGTTSATILTSIPVNGSVYGTITIPTAGIYLFTFGIYQGLTALGTTNYVNIGGANVAICNFGCTNIVTLQIGFVGTQVIQATATNYTLTLSTSSVCANPANQGGYFQAIRIA